MRAEVVSWGNEGLGWSSRAKKESAKRATQTAMVGMKERLTAAATAALWIEKRATGVWVEGKRGRAKRRLEACGRRRGGGEGVDSVTLAAGWPISARRAESGK